MPLLPLYRVCFEWKYGFEYEQTEKKKRFEFNLTVLFSLFIIFLFSEWENKRREETVGKRQKCERSNEHRYGSKTEPKIRQIIDRMFCN